MIDFWYINKDFTKERSTRIGSSTIPALFPNPENPTESLAGYGNTALTVYQEKIGEKQRDPVGLAAEMGHFLENKSLELFIRRFSSRLDGSDFISAKQEWERISKDERLMKIQPDYAKRIEHYQHTHYKHNTQYYIDGMIAHPDCVYIGDPSLVGLPKKERVKTVDGIEVDMSKPFIIEAKSARMMAAKRPDGSLVKGYDKKLTSWQGIPLKHYFQIQFQLALFEIDVAYLALISDTSDFHVWRIDADRGYQKHIIDTVGLMLKAIENRIPPRELAMNQSDITILYPELKKDFIMLNGEKLEAVKKACIEKWKASQQIKNWKGKEKDATDALAVYLKDYAEIRDGSECLAKWQERKGSESITKPDEAGKDSMIDYLKKNDKPAYRYLIKRGYITTGKDTRFVKVKFKGE